MAETTVETSLRDRLRLFKYSRDDCLAALRGEKIPHALGHPLHRLCIIRGIRYHPGFGGELRGLLPVFTRALNARSILSNVVPDMVSPDEFPYCIWHPTTASEGTYRELARRYPQMVFHVGRACAVAGYTQLYEELDLAPDVHIAEEARECGSAAIYSAIMSQPVRYSIMNDYTLSTDPQNRLPAYLNGDTAVRWMLDVKQKFQSATSHFVEEADGTFVAIALFDSIGFEDTTFNITEDMHIDEKESDEVTQRILVASRPDVRFFSEPLPADLPTVQKDLLILMAAYYGDVDRYARLRRPKLVRKERACCIRGIYHNTFFAVWWSKQPERPHSFERAINARFIMNNVLSRAPFRSIDEPYLIWWPAHAKQSTYRHLAKIQPEMLPQILRACIHIGYKDLFDELLPQVTPEKDLLCEAEEQIQPHFREALNERIKSLGITPPDLYYDWKMKESRGFGSSSNTVLKHFGTDTIRTSSYVPYDGTGCDAADVELIACLPDAWKIADDDWNISDDGDWRIADDDERVTRDLNYETWPPGLANADSERNEDKASEVASERNEDKTSEVASESWEFVDPA